MSTRHSAESELRPGEQWVGNTGTSLPEHLNGFSTARLGAQAYDIDGNKIPPDQMRPLFIGASELDKYNDVMMTRTFGPNWRRNR